MYWDLTGRHSPSDFFATFGLDRRHVYNRSVSPLWDGAYLQGGGEASFHPGYSRGSLLGEWAPMKPFKLRASYDLLGYFGANSGLLSFATSGDAFGSGGRNLRQGREEAEVGQRFKISPSLRGRLGRVIVVSEADFAWYSFSGNGPYFLELEYDTLLQRSDLIMANRTDLLFEFDKGSDGGRVWAGLFHSYVNPRSNFLERHRLGVVAEWAPARRAWGLDRPRFHGRAGVNMKDRNRQKQFFFEAGIGAEFDWYR